MKLDFFSAAPRPADEADRQAAVDAINPAAFSDPRLQAIVDRVCVLLDTPMAAVSIIDGDRQLFVACRSLPVAETPRATAICAHGLDGDRQLRSYDDLAVDRRFRFNPLVAGALQLRGYVGAPLVTEDGHALGALCAMDTVPRAAPDAERAAALQALAAEVTAIIAAPRP